MSNESPDVSLTEYTSFDERYSHNKDNPNNQYTLSGDQLRDSSASKIYKESDQAVEVPEDGKVYVDRYNTQTHEMEMKPVKPVIDLTESIDNEGIRRGLNHPAMLNDLNTVYLNRFAEAVKGPLSLQGFLDRTTEYSKLRDNPDEVYAESFRKWSENFARDAEEEGTEKLKLEAEEKAKWNKALAERIEKYPNAFMYREPGEWIGEGYQHSAVVAVVRPQETDTELSCFTYNGLIDVSSQGLKGEDLLDVIKAIHPTQITGYAMSVQEGKEQNTITFNMEDLRRSLGRGDYNRNPEYNLNAQALDRIQPKTESVTLTFKMGYDTESMNITQSEILALKDKLEQASTKPWPNLEQRKEDKQKSETVVQKNVGPTGADFLSMI